MGRLRRLADAAIAKMDEIGERETAKELAKLSPAEREHYDAWEERTAHFNATGEIQEGKLVNQALLGPAGEAVHGVVKKPKPPDPIADPAQREAVAAAEREARAQARAPYVAPGGPPVQRLRFATQVDSQGAEVCAQLAATGLAGRPDLVYGVYRVPDMIGPGSLRGERIVEWEVVHAAREPLPLPPAPPPADVVFDARKQWVGRRVGEPRPHDEEVALAYLHRAGIGPERTLGLARHVSMHTHSSGDEGAGRLFAMVRGIHVFHAGQPAPALAEWEAAAPIALSGLPDGVRSERLNWEAVARAVAPVRRHREPVPSPWPYLPLTAGELATSYLQVVGLAPSDTYGVQVTYGKAFDLMSRSHKSGFVRIKGGGEDMPCADGEWRKRILGGSQVVVTYRDRPEYAAGRERWAAYSRDVLRAELWRRLSGGEPVPKPTGRLEKTLDVAYDIASIFDTDLLGTDGFEEPPRYCWPPVR